MVMFISSFPVDVLVVVVELGQDMRNEFCQQELCSLDKVEQKWRGAICKPRDGTLFDQNNPKQ